ncbi:conserved hypothetical protein [Theileria orientalis strain Shintoku]|uniref:Uncharacterized protein n=1 Tax=Theileria orientalis strain Shintoku TaxID=869250 RepID=J4CDH5_THEOR|nr:conserved hypothetical protein [Theileria orientalis strain Shintoku]BAM41152.1 conserved hypothetical protein [Theileria orientalis strain Shintoku]|eukprot:XP_009691453.1 conserved hypothetical protein [Theileria orientalis strain Shintoku]
MLSLKETDYNQNKYIALDLEKFFRENDELTMLKTLQEMYVSSYNLELEMKSLVTNELDSVLLCVDTILQMCSLIKQSKNNLDTISKTVNEFNYDEIFEEACKNKVDVPDLEVNELKLLLDGWMSNYNRECIENETYGSESTHIDLNRDLLFQNYGNFVERCKNVKIYVKSIVSEHLHGMTMSNYRLLKRNRLLNSYELLYVKVPLLLNLLEELGGEDTNGLTKETERMCEFCKKKLRSHCLTNLSSSEVEVLLESVSVMFLLDGKGRENAEFLLKRRLEMYNIASSALVSGSLGVLTKLFSHFFANEVLYEVLTLYTKEVSLDRSIFRESYEPKLLDQLGSYSLVKLIQVKQVVSQHIQELSVDFDGCKLKDKLEEKRAFLNEEFEKTWTKCTNDKIANIMLTISGSVNSYTKIKRDLGDFSEYFDSQDFVENTKHDVDEMVTELNEFLLSEKSFSHLVDRKLDATMEKVKEQMALREFKHGRMEALTVYSIQEYNTKFKAWLGENGVLDSLQVLNKFKPTKNVYALYEIVTNRYLDPLVKAAAKKAESHRTSKSTRVDQPGDSAEPTDNSQEGGKLEDKEDDSESEEKREGDNGLYMVMVAYAASNLKSYINELSGFRECVLSKHLEESALAAGMEYYIKNITGGTLGKSAERDAGILSMICGDKLERSDAGLKEKYTQFKNKLPDGRKYEKFYASFKNLM